MTEAKFQRRSFLSAVSVAALGAGSLPAVAGADHEPVTEDFTYEVDRSLSEWLQLLSEEEFRIMRLGGTEVPHTSKVWNEEREGTYTCKGCDLTIYESGYKVKLDKGWAFYRHARPDTVLTGIDGNPYVGMGQNMDDNDSLIEVHCRRCGSHLGHIVWVQRKLLHCINGIALNFQPMNA